MTKFTQLGTAIAIAFALCALTANLPSGLAQGMMGGNITTGGNATTPTYNVSYAVQLFQAAGLTFQNSTIFVPDNDAFEALPLEISKITDLLNATYASNSSFILGLHVVPGVWRSSDFPTGNLTLNTTGGIPITIDNEPGGILIYVPGSDVQAYVEQADIPFMTNVLHIIDTVLLPFPTLNDVTIEAPANTTGAGPSTPPP